MPPIVTQPRAASASTAALDAARSYFANARETGDFTGGDATYSIPMAGGRTAWVFGDSFVGGVHSDGSRSYDPATFVRNSLVLQEPDQSMRMVTGTQDGVPVDAAIPPGMRVNRDGSLPDEWYWPGHGTTRGNELLVFMNRFDHPPERTDPLGWDWRYRGTDLARFDTKTGALLGTQKMTEAGDVLWGAAVLERGEHTYIYGAEDDPAGSTRHAHVARAPREELTKPEAWEFWNGTAWTDSATDSARIGPRVSPQFSVLDAKDGSTLLVTQDGLDPAIRVWRADRPEGPYSDGVEIARTPDPGFARHTYNTVAHPQFSGEDGSLVLSYNRGGMDFMDDHNSYRPGFITVPGSDIPGGGVVSQDT